MGDIVSGAIGGLVSGVGSLIGGKKRQRNEQNALRIGFDYAKDSPLKTSYSPTGAAANDEIASILGVGGGAGGRFDSGSYLEKYPDVAKAATGLTDEDRQYLRDQGYGATADEFARYHYDRYGKAEGRKLPGAEGAGGAGDGAANPLGAFADSPAFDLIKRKALGGATSSSAAGGKLRSGATLKALQDRAGSIASAQLPMYLNYLGSLADRGFNAESNITGAGTEIAGANAGAVREGQNNRLTGITDLATTGLNFLTGGF